MAEPWNGDTDCLAESALQWQLYAGQGHMNTGYLAREAWHGLSPSLVVVQFTRTGLTNSGRLSSIRKYCIL